MPFGGVRQPVEELEVHSSSTGRRTAFDDEATSVLEKPGWASDAKPAAPVGVRPGAGAAKGAP